MANCSGAPRPANFRKWHETDLPTARIEIRFTPTSPSWLNAVEGFFATLTRRRLKHGVFHS